MDQFLRKKDFFDFVTSLEKGEKFVAREIEITEEICLEFVQFIIDPNRFIPKIFDGNWAFPDRHPKPGSIKLLRFMQGGDGQNRLIARQGSKVYASPWI